MGTRHSSYNANKIHSLRTRDEKELLLRKPPRDTCWLAYMIFFLHGIGHLLPWNFFITAKQVKIIVTNYNYALHNQFSLITALKTFLQYFEMKFKCPSNNSSCAEILETHFENFFSVASMIPIFLMSLLNVWLQSK